MDDFVLNVRQVFQYPQQSTAVAGDAVLLQKTGPDPANPAAGPYGTMDILDIIAQARKQGGPIALNLNEAISWGASGLLNFDGSGFSFNSPVTVPSLTASGSINAASVTTGGVPVADQDWVTALFDSLVNGTVWSVNGRRGNVVLDRNDILKAGAVPNQNPNFCGIVTAPTPWDIRLCDNRVPTTAWVQKRLAALSTAEINAAYFRSPPGVWPRAPNPALGDASTRIATTSFVDESLDYIADVVQRELEDFYAPLYSPHFQGVPTAPTAVPGSASAQLATTAFVHNAIVESTTGVSHFMGRTGSVVLEATDIEAAGGALLISPIFLGTPKAPRAAPSTNNDQIATCEWVLDELVAISSGVISFNGRAGEVRLIPTDIIEGGGAPILSPVFMGSPTTTHPAANDDSNRVPTTSWVRNVAGVNSFNGRTGAITLQGNDISAAGGALALSPVFSGQPQAPTAAVGTSTQQLATTQFVQSALATGVGVSTFMGRAGNITLTFADVQSTNSVWSTGDCKLTYKAVADPGWLMMNDSTIGAPGSGAQYANANALALFTLFFNVIVDAWAPIYAAGGALTTRSAYANAQACFNSLAVMFLPRVLGRALTGAGAGTGLTPRALGEYGGAESYTQTYATLVSHLHLLPYGDAGIIVVPNSPQAYYAVQSNGQPWNTGTGSTGNSQPFWVLNPGCHMNVMVCL